jgi:hypothetical protein
MTTRSGSRVAAARRESRRRAQMLFSTLLLVASVTAMGFRSGAMAAVLSVVVVVAALVVAHAVSLTRARQLGPCLWRASLPAWAATQTGMRVRNLRPNSELLGQLRVDRRDIFWSPSAPSRRLGASDVRWPFAEVSAVNVSSVWGLIPLACLELQLVSGQQVDIWVRHPADLRTAVEQRYRM